MAETIHEQIAQWIATVLDGQQDPDKTLTLRAVRPKVLDWGVEDFKHGDVIIEAGNDKDGKSITTITVTEKSRQELAVWNVSGIIHSLPENTSADTVISRMIETIRKLLLAGNVACRACDGIAQSIDCPSAAFDICSGGVIAEVTVNVLYWTSLKDGYMQA